MVKKTIFKRIYCVFFFKWLESHNYWEILKMYTKKYFKYLCLRGKHIKKSKSPITNCWEIRFFSTFWRFAELIDKFIWEFAVYVKRKCTGEKISGTVETINLWNRKTTLLNSNYDFKQFWNTVIVLGFV